MQHTRTLTALSLAATLSLILASCGGGSTPTPTPTPGDDNATGTPVKGGTIARPANSTAANEFIVTGQRAALLGQALGVQNVGSAQNVMARFGALGTLAVEDDMRVLLAITRAKTGDNAGKKHAVATFVWGNGAEKIVPIDTSTDALTLDIYPQDTPNSYERYKGGLNMMVTYPDFQDKTTRSGGYITDTGAACASLTFNFKSASTANPVPNGYTPLVFDNSASPLEVCEGADERNAEQVALEKYSDNLMFDADSLGAAPWAFTKHDDDTALPTNAATLAAAVGSSSSATVTTQTLALFMAPLKVLPAGDSMTWTPDEKKAAAIAKKYMALEKQFGYYYRSVTVYTVATSSSRNDIYILGLNGWGVGGLHTIQFK